MFSKFFGPSAAEKEAESRNIKFFERYRDEFTTCGIERAKLSVERGKLFLKETENAMKFIDYVAENPTEKNLAKLKAHDYTIPPAAVGPK